MDNEPKEKMPPITFEGIELSPISLAIDHLGMYGNLPEISEDTSKWLWRFTICRGVNNKDISENIRKHVEETLSIANNKREHLLKNIPKHYDGEFTEYHLDLWMNDLKTMLEICKSKKSCTWTANE